MKSTLRFSRLLRLSAAATALTVAVSSASAATRTKANNNNNLNLTTSWSGGVPGSGDVALWNNTVTGANTVVLGADMTIGQIQITNPGGLVTINSGNTLTLAAISGVGIDMSTATQNLTLNNDVTISASQSWNIVSGKTLTIGGTVNLSGAITLTMSSLTGSGTFGNNGGNSTTSTLNVGSNNDSTTFSGQINKNGNREVALVKVGTGALTLTGSSNYSAGTTLKSGTIVAGNSTALGAGTVLLGDTSGTSNASLLTSGAVTIGNTITVQSGNTGVMTIGGNTADASTFSANVSFGTASGTAKGATFVALAGGTATFSGVLNESSSVPASSVIIGDASHNGTVKFSNVANAYGGTTTIGNGATLEVVKLANGGSNSSIGNSGSSAAAGSAASDLVLDNGTLKYTGTGDSTNRLFTFGPNGATIDASASANGALNFTGTGSLVASGTGNRTLTLTGTSTGANTMTSVIADPSSGATSVTKSGTGTWKLSGANTYTGGTNVNAGTLALGASNVLANTGAVNVNGGTLDIAGNSDTVGAVALSSGNINGTTGTLTGSSYGVQTGSISAKLGGSGALTKTTAGTVILTGANSYTGGTNVNAGTLALNANNVLPTSGVVTLGGGTLQLNATQQGTTASAGAGALSLASNSIIDLAGTDLMHFLASNGQSWSGTLSIYNWNGSPITGGGAEQILFGSDSTALTALQLGQITFYSDAGVTSLGTAAFATSDNGEIVPTFDPIPEPSTWLAATLVGATLVVVHYRRRRLTSAAGV